MKYTDNLKLKMPDSTDFYNVQDFNDNADVIDKAVQEVKDNQSNIDAALREKANTTDVEEALKGKSDINHKHTVANITDFPEALPANGGNADTVDGKHANEFALSENPTINGDITITNWNATHTVKIFAWEDTIVIRNNDKNGNYTDLVIGSDGIYKQRMINGEYTGRTNINDGGAAATADHAGSQAATASNICLRNLASGTAAATWDSTTSTGTCPPGAWYGQHS